MTRNIHAPNYDYPEDTFVYGVESGGTGGRTTRAAATALGAISLDDVGLPGGPVPIVGKYIPQNVLPVGIPGFPTVSGPGLIYDYVSNTFQITNYDSNLSYSVTATVGTVSISGDTITYSTSLGTAPYTPPVAGGFTLNGKVFNVLVSPAYIATPSITSPVDAAIDRPTTLTITSSPFQSMGVPSGHGSTTWQVATDSAFTNLVINSVNDTVNLTSYTTSDLTENTTYYARVTYKTISGVSSWVSATSMFSTKKNVASVETALLTRPNMHLRISESSLAISDAGDLVASTSVNAATAVIFKNTSGSWGVQATLTDPNARTGINFGSSCVLSGDGSRLFIGASTGPGAGQACGIVYVYLWSGTAWALEATLKPVTNSYKYIGNTLAVSQAGDFLVIGAPGSTGDVYGSAFVYQRTGTTWALIKEILHTPTSGNYYGRRVACNSDATVIVTTSTDVNTGNTTLLPEVWTRNGTSFALLQTLAYLSGQDATSQFGSSVAISRDSSTIVVGALGVHSLAVYKKSGSTYNWVQTINAPNPPVGSAGFGRTVCLTADGKYLVAYANNNGYVATFEWSLGSYKQIHIVQGTDTWLGRNAIAVTPNDLCAAYSDAGYAVTGANDGAIHIYS